MKKFSAIIMVLVLVLCLSGCGKSPENSSYTTSETVTVFKGKILEINGSAVIVEPFENEEIRKTADKISFGTSNLENLDVKAGDKVEVTYNGEVMTTYPAQIFAKKWQKIETDISVNPKTPDDVYCGNTQTTVYIGDDKYTFMGGYSVSLTSLLRSLKYDKAKVCKCLPEYYVDTEFGTGYGIHLTEGYARSNDGQAELSSEQIKEVKEIIKWVKTQEPDQDFKVTAGESKTDFEGVKINFKKIDFTRDKMNIIIDWVNETDYEVVYGENYTIERLVNGEWFSCSVEADGPYFNAIGIILKANTTNEETYVYSDIFDISKAGKYRFKTNCIVYKNGQDSAGEACNLSVEFTLK